MVRTYNIVPNIRRVCVAQQELHLITTRPERENFFALSLSFIRATMESSSVHQG